MKLTLKCFLVVARVSPVGGGEVDRLRRESEISVLVVARVSPVGGGEVDRLHRESGIRRLEEVESSRLHRKSQA